MHLEQFTWVLSCQVYIGGTAPTLMPLSLQQDTTTLLIEMAMRPLLLSLLSMELPSASRML